MESIDNDLYDCTACKKGTKQWSARVAVSRPPRPLFSTNAVSVPPCKVDALPGAACAFEGSYYTPATLSSYSAHDCFHEEYTVSAPLLLRSTRFFTQVLTPLR